MGSLAHAEGGLSTDASLRPRASVLLGPGATFQGTADGLLGLYAVAAGAGGSAAPTRDELARAIVVYNQHHLPAGTWVEHRVGLRLPLPVEIDVDSGAWIVNADSVRTWAGSFDGAWLGRLTRAPDALEIPDPLVELPQAAAALLAAHPDAPSLGAELAARVLRNPFADVFLVFAALRRLGAGAPEAALSMLDDMVGHQAALLAATSAGSAVLRRLDALLAGAPAALDPARVARARALLDAALFTGAPGQRTRVAFSELPETPAQLAGRGPLGAAGADRDPPGGYHRLVLGRDVGVGQIATETILGVDYRGPAYAGRLPPAPFVAADAALLPTDAQSTARLEIVVGIAANEGNLDAIRPTRPRGDLERHPPVVGPRAGGAAVAALPLQDAGRRRVGPLLRRVRARRRARSGSRPCRAVRAPERRRGRDPHADGVRRDPGFLRRHRWRRRDGVVRHRLGARASGWRRSPRRPTGAARSSRRSAASTASSDRSAASRSRALPSRSSSSSPPSRALRWSSTRTSTSPAG